MKKTSLTQVKSFLSESKNDKKKFYNGDGFSIEKEIEVTRKEKDMQNSAKDLLPSFS